MMTGMLTMLAQAPQVDHSYDLTVGGWVVMVLSVTFVTSLMVWCFRRVLKESSTEKLHSQVDIETPDVE